jgi:hypothetical protein
VREILVDGKREVESTSFIHALIGLDCQNEVENVVRVWKFGAPCLAWFKFCQIYKDVSCYMRLVTIGLFTFLNT